MTIHWHARNHSRRASAATRKRFENAYISEEALLHAVKKVCLPTDEIDLSIHVLIYLATGLGRIVAYPYSALESAKVFWPEEQITTPEQDQPLPYPMLGVRTRWRYPASQPAATDFCIMATHCNGLCARNLHRLMYAIATYKKLDMNEFLVNGDIPYRNWYQDTYVYPVRGCEWNESIAINAALLDGNYWRDVDLNAFFTSKTTED